MTTTDRAPFGATTPALDAWMEDHRDPAWKYKAPRIAKLGKAKGAGKDQEFAALVREYRYAVTETIDRRQIREPLELAAWIERKRETAPAFKPYKVPAPKTALSTMSASARTAESNRITRYLSSRRAA